MMARDLARALDPVQLAHDCGIVPDAWQAKLLRERPRRSLLLCSRQKRQEHRDGPHGPDGPHCSKRPRPSRHRLPEPAPER